MIHVTEHHCKLKDEQKEYITEKMEHVLRHLGKMAQNEALEAKVTITYEDTKRVDDHFLCSATIVVPKLSTLHSEVRAMTPEAAIDLCEEKLKKQIETMRTAVMG